MYAIAFDLLIGDLKKYYGDPYHGAYFDVRTLLKKHGFEWTQGSVYMSKPNMENSLTHVYKAINDLSQIDWFKKSVRDIRVFKVEDWSDFTETVKE